VGRDTASIQNKKEGRVQYILTTYNRAQNNRTRWLDKMTVQNNFWPDIPNFQRTFDQSSAYFGWSLSVDLPLFWALYNYMMVSVTLLGNWGFFEFHVMTKRKKETSAKVMFVFLSSMCELIPSFSKWSRYFPVHIFGRLLTIDKHDLAEVSFFLLDRWGNHKETSAKQGRSGQLIKQNFSEISSFLWILQYL